MVLAVTFRVENSIFAEWLRTAVREDGTTKAILEEIGRGDIKKFTKEDKFLLF